MSRFSVAKARAIDDLESLIEELLHASRKHKRTGLWNVANPYRAHAKPDQMCVWLTGNRRGAWKDYVSGDKGDAIDLVAYALSGLVSDESRMDAVAWLEERYGLKDMDPVAKRRMEAEAKSRRMAAEARESERRESNITRSRKFFYGCNETVTDTPVEAYLASRGIALSAIPALGHAIRYRAECQYWMDDDRPFLPAMIHAMVTAEGRVAANHYTFLQPDGSGKADVDKAKLMFPETTGLVIRLTNGAAGIGAEKAAAAGISGLVGVVEGTEDGYSAAIAAPDLRMWATGSLSGLLSLPDHASASGYIIFQDNDWGKRQAQGLFRRAVARIKGFGKPVEVISMPASWGKDVNDAFKRRSW
ncbi:DUF7146 domain-containing protein [Martelella mediterranea]|uniref:Toprim domain-containing protein n=1 Tax=Martelella mediterranea TaxID=293089 RepID=A0A4V2V3M2_9HYPH|nr:hypothetical protein [Martelella mediterranea]TCT34635.1 hypothetical protein EDC90_103329 [Martelella mediterranea]